MLLQAVARAARAARVRVARSKLLPQMHLRLAVPFPWQRVSQLLVYLAHFVCRAALCQRALPPMYLCRVETFLLQVVLCESVALVTVH